MTREEKVLLSKLLSKYSEDKNQICKYDCHNCELGIMKTAYDSDSCAIDVVLEKLNYEINSTTKTSRVPTGFKDYNGREIFVGDFVYEGCNGCISNVRWDNEKGTYKLAGLGNYYIEDASTDWIVLDTTEDLVSKFNIPQDDTIMSIECGNALEEYFKDQIKKL